MNLAFIYPEFRFWGKYNSSSKDLNIFLLKGKYFFSKTHHFLRMGFGRHMGMFDLGYNLLGRKFFKIHGLRVSIH